MLKKFKQELVFIPLMLVLIELFRQVVYHYFPDTAMFDRGSELETYLTRVWQITWITCGAWVLLWVTFPSVHKALHDFYHGFDKLEANEKRSIALKFFFCFFFGLVFLMSGRAEQLTVDSSQLTVESSQLTVGSSEFNENQDLRIKNQETVIRVRLVDTLTAQLYVRELTGNNDGVDVEKYLVFVGQKKGASWCAAFCSWNLNAVGVASPPNPKTAWSPSFAVNHVVWTAGMQKQHRVKAPPKHGDCFTLYYSNLKRVGHVGFIVGSENGYWITIEGNTGTGGSREGAGVHKLKRAKGKVYAITDYIGSRQLAVGSRQRNIQKQIIKNTDEKNISSIAVVRDDNGVQPEVNPVDGKEFGENSIYFSKNGYDYFARHKLCVQRGQCEDYGYGYNGFARRCEYAGGGNGFATNKIKDFHYRREVIGRMYLQRFGSEGCMAGTSHYRTYSNCPGEATGKGSYQYHRSKIYPYLG